MVGHFKYFQVEKNSRAYPYLKLHILFHSNGLAIWHGFPDIRHIKVNYGLWSANRIGKISKNPKGTSTPPKGCVCKKLEKSRLGLQSSAPETKMRTPDGRTDGRTDGHPRRRQYPPPPLRRAGDKNMVSYVPSIK